MFLRQIALVLACLVATGCASTRYETRVNGFASASFDRTTTHVILPVEGQKGDLQFQEVSAQVKRALQAGGITVVDPPAPAQVAILIGYGIGEPKTVTSAVAVPIFGQTGVGSATTTGTASTFGGMTTVNATTTYNPTYGVVGSQVVPVSSTTYDRYLTLTAYDLQAHARTNAIKQLWQIQVRSTGTSGDLRQVLPYMMASAEPWVGRSTGRELVITVPESDPKTEFVRSGAAPTK